MTLNLTAVGGPNDPFGSVVPPGAGGPGSGGSSTSAAAIAAASLHTSTSAQLEVKTLEGDTVTLSASFGADLTLGALGASSNGTGATARYASLETQRSLTVQVQGDLSASEQSDIAKLVRSFLHDLKNFLRGGGSGASVAANPAGISTIASSQEQFQHSESVTLVAAGAQSQTTASSRPAAVPQPVAPAVGDGAGTPAAPAAPLDGDGDHDGSRAGDHGSGGGLAGLIGRFLHDARSAGVPRHGLYRMFEQALGALRRDPSWSGHATTIARAEDGVKQGLVAPGPVAPVAPAGSDTGGN